MEAVTLFAAGACDIFSVQSSLGVLPSAEATGRVTHAMPSSRSEKLLADRLQNAGPGEPVDLWIYSAFPKDNWVARKPGSLTRADHPGTAIQIADELFEILTAQETTEPGNVVRYGLKRWDAQHTVRLVIPYTLETQAQSVADYLEEEHNRKLRTCLLWFFPLAGLAPDPLQLEWENKTAVNMTVASAASAVTTLFFCMALVQIFGRSAAGSRFFFLVDYLAFESAYRVVRIVFSGKPRGTLILTLPYLLWEAVARPETRRRREEDRLKFTLDQDEVIRRPGTGRLLIRSMLFDDMLAGTNPIRFEGAAYNPIHWYEQGKGIRRRFVYELEKVEGEGKSREYTVPRAPERQRAVEAFTRSRDRVQILALFWGTFPRHEQLRLEAKYDFPAAKWTATTAGFLLACAVLEIWAVILFHATIYAAVTPVYLIFESLYRLYQARFGGLPAGSLAGYVFGLFLRPPR